MSFQELRQAAIDYLAKVLAGEEADHNRIHAALSILAMSVESKP
jgi:hypothetical protein